MYAIRSYYADVIRKYWEEGEDELPSFAPATPNAVKAVFSDKESILSMLDRCKQNKKRAAELLGMDRTTLYRKLRQYGIPAKKNEDN